MAAKHFRYCIHKGRERAIELADEAASRGQACFVLADAVGQVFVSTRKERDMELVHEAKSSTTRKEG